MSHFQVTMTAYFTVQTVILVVSFFPGSVFPAHIQLEHQFIDTPTEHLQHERLKRFTDDAEVKANSVCVDYTPSTYFPSGTGTNQASVPVTSGTDIIGRPTQTLSVCELELLHKECVARINEYRAGTISFSDGGNDPLATSGQLSALNAWSARHECSSKQALGDLKSQSDSGSASDCAAAHENAGKCSGFSQAVQNSCCLRGTSERPIDSFSGIKESMFECLQQMWDEGSPSFQGVKSHWEIMRMQNMKSVSCGFAFNEDGEIWLTQDFTPTQVNPDQCSCKGKQPGDSDGCGGTCVGCSDPPVDSFCQDAEFSTVSGPIQVCSGSPTYEFGGQEYAPCKCNEAPASYCSSDNFKQYCPQTCNTCPEEMHSTCPTTREAECPPVSQCTKRARARRRVGGETAFRNGSGSRN